MLANTVMDKQHIVDDLRGLGNMLGLMWPEFEDARMEKQYKSIANVSQWVIDRLLKGTYDKEDNNG